MTFGERLKMLRKRGELSQTALSELTGVPQTTISDLENDKYLPSIGQAKILAKALGTTVSELIDEQAATSA